MARRKLEVQIVGDASKLEKSFRQASRSARGFGGAFGKRGGFGGFGGMAIGGRAGVIGASAAAGTALATKGLKDVISAAKEAEVAQAGLRQAVKVSGVSYALFGKQIEATIQSQSKLAGIDDEEVSQSFANLLRTTGSVSKATKGLALAANIARARHISLAAAAKVVEKAENGQLRGLKALGVEINSNTTSSQALEQAQRKFAGSAEAYGKTAAGAQDKLSVAFENLQERIGKKLLPVITRLAVKLVDLLDWSEKNWPRFSKAVRDAYSKAKPVIDNIVAIVKGISQVVEGMVRIVHGIVTGDWAQAWRGLKQFALDGIAGVVKAVATLPVKLLAGLGKAAFKGLSKIGGWIGDAIMDGLRAALQKVADMIDSFSGKVNSLTGAFGKIGVDIPKIPKIGKVGGSPAKTGTARPRPVPDAVQDAQHSRAKRTTSSTGGVTINGPINLNGIQDAAGLLRELQRIGNTGSTPRRGRYGGANLGIG